MSIFYGERYYEGQEQTPAEAERTPPALYPLEIATWVDSSRRRPSRAGGETEQLGSDILERMWEALACWNQALTLNNVAAQERFLHLAQELLEQEQPVGERAGGWPISAPPGTDHSSSRTHYLSATLQASGLAVLLRAFSLTGEERYLAASERVVQTFLLDILDGGVRTPLYEDGIFFEELAIYPATHRFNGMAFALLALYEAQRYHPTPALEELCQRGLATLERSLEEFDSGFWAYHDLTTRRLCEPEELDEQVTLLEALVRMTGSQCCERARQRWRGYRQHWGSLLRQRWQATRRRCWQALWRRWQRRLFPRIPAPAGRVRVCVPLPAFPAMGGVLTVLETVEQVTQDHWQLEFMTRAVGEHSGTYVVHRFGRPWMGATHFPFVWLYALTGMGKLFALLRRGASFDLLLPQDAVFSAFLAAPLARLAGARVVCIDHGHLTLLHEEVYPTYLAERKQFLARRSRLRRIIGRFQEWCYWPSYRFMLRCAARYVDQYLAPGVPGDGVETMGERFGIPASRIIRFASMVDVNRHPLLSNEERTRARHEKGLASDAIIVTMACRLSPEKGIDLALASFEQALSGLAGELRRRVRLIIAGDGPLRQEVEASIAARGLQENCQMWGELGGEEIAHLLSISDIFLYTSTRGACFSMAVLEAMAAGCAVIASTRPASNTLLLAEERGIAVSPADLAQTAAALARLIADPERCRRMGLAARAYIARYHSAEAFRRILLRVSFWPGLEDLAKNSYLGEREGESQG
jgi:glycosyltransferase involved in cell wall biosynthesis